MAFDFQKLIEMAPFLMGAFQGPSPEGTAMLEGYVKGQQGKRTLADHERELKRQELLDLLQQQDRTDQRENRRLDNERADRGLALQEDAAKRAAATAGLSEQTGALNRLRGLQDVAGTRADQIAAGPESDASTPDAQNQLAESLFQLTQSAGAPASAARGLLPNMSGLIAERDKKHYREALEKVTKDPRYAGVVTTPEFDQLTIKDRKGQLIKVGDVKAQLGEQVTDPSGFPVPGAAVDPEAKTAGSFDAQFADVLAAAEEKAGRKLTRTEKAALRLKAKDAFEKAGDRAANAPRVRYQVAPVTNPDGTTGLVRINMETGDASRVALPEGAAAGKPTDAQRLSADFLGRTTAADQTATSFEAKLTGLGKQFDVQLPNLLRSEAGQLYRNAQDEFINAGLRDESGAAIQPSEYDRYRGIYFMVPGDSLAVLKQKQAARQRVRDGQRVQTGNLAPKTDSTPKPAPKRYNPATGKVE